MNFFIPGTHPDLSKAELEALDPNISFSTVSDSVFVGETTESFGDILNQASGVIKAGTIFTAIKNYDRETLAATLQASVELGGHKLPIGISVYDAGNEPVFKTLQ